MHLSIVWTVCWMLEKPVPFHPSACEICVSLMAKDCSSELCSSFRGIQSCAAWAILETSSTETLSRAILSWPVVSGHWKRTIFERIWSESPHRAVKWSCDQLSIEQLSGWRSQPIVWSALYTKIHPLYSLISCLNMKLIITSLLLIFGVHYVSSCGMMFCICHWFLSHLFLYSHSMRDGEHQAPDREWDSNQRK